MTSPRQILNRARPPQPARGCGAENIQSLGSALAFQSFIVPLGRTPEFARCAEIRSRNACQHPVPRQSRVVFDASCHVAPRLRAPL